VAEERVTGSELETLALAERLGRSLHGGEVVLLSGELGCGKTVFVRGLARGIGVDPERVSSPTFVLLTAYPGRLWLHHADLYRLDAVDVDLELELAELPGEDGVLAVEWAERLSGMTWDEVRRVGLGHLGEDRRLVVLEGWERKAA
jgi:tRNA threonylcarbamoyladenosine biosynthesis protein TsaE